MDFQPARQSHLSKKEVVLFLYLISRKQGRLDVRNYSSYCAHWDTRIQVCYELKAVDSFLYLPTSFFAHHCIIPNPLFS